MKLVNVFDKVKKALKWAFNELIGDSLDELKGEAPKQRERVRVSRPSFIPQVIEESPRMKELEEEIQQQKEILKRLEEEKKAERKRQLSTWIDNNRQLDELYSKLRQA